jgi:hypothetical protein
MNKPNPNDPHGLYKAADELFRSDRHPLAKILAAGGLGLVMSVGILFEIEGLTALAWCGYAAVLGGGFAFVAALLLMADRTQRRQKSGERVGLIARILFGAGIWSLLIWIVIALALGFPLAVWVGNKTWQRGPAIHGPGDRQQQKPPG